MAVVSKKFGAFWVNRYQGRNGLPTLDHSDENKKGFLDKMALTGKFGFDLGDSKALDQDVEQQGLGGSTISAGNDSAIAETVDLLYFSGHGDMETLYFYQFITTKFDNNEAKYWEMQLGDGGILKWFVADACQVLNNSLDPFTYCPNGPNTSLYTVFNFLNWRRCFRGLRYILGFDTSCHDVEDRGCRFAGYLNTGDRLHEAWRKACVETEYDANIRCAYLHPGRETDLIHSDSWMAADPGPETVYAAASAAVAAAAATGSAAASAAAANLDAYPFTYVSTPCGTNPVSCQS